MNSQRNITTRVSAETGAGVELYAKERGLTVSKAAAELLTTALREWRMASLGPWNAIKTVVVPTGSVIRHPDDSDPE